MECWTTPETTFQGRIFRVVAGGVALNDGTPAYREVVEHPGGVCVLPYNNGEVTLVRQFRIAVGEYVLEAPAGKLEPGDTPQNRARRELEEETGLYGADWVDLGIIFGTVGFCSERIHLFLALNAQQGHARPESEERIEVVRIPLDEALGLARDGSLRDSKTLVLLMKLNDHVRHL
jgi:ADP-ribose pyrophosphatase